MFKQLSFGLALALVIALCPVPTNAIVFYGFEDTAPEMTYEQPNEGTPVTFEAYFPDGTAAYPLDVSAFPSGTYFLQIKSNAFGAPRRLYIIK